MLVQSKTPRETCIKQDNIFTGANKCCTVVAIVSVPAVAHNFVRDRMSCFNRFSGLKCLGCPFWVSSGPVVSYRQCCLGGFEAASADAAEQDWDQ